MLPCDPRAAHGMVGESTNSPLRCMKEIRMPLEDRSCMLVSRAAPRPAALWQMTHPERSQGHQRLPRAHSQSAGSRRNWDPHGVETPPLRHQTRLAGAADPAASHSPARLDRQPAASRSWPGHRAAPARPSAAAGRATGRGGGRETGAGFRAPAVSSQWSCAVAFWVSRGFPAVGKVDAVGLVTFHGMGC